MITEKTGRLYFHHNDGSKVEHFICQCSSCEYGKVDDAYSKLHIKQLGWVLVEEKDGPKIYCPECAKK